MEKEKQPLLDERGVFIKHVKNQPQSYIDRRVVIILLLCLVVLILLILIRVIMYYVVKRY
jgi:hypothetical protein